MRSEGSKTNLLRQRTVECLAMAMIGDGALALLDAERHEKLWERGPKFWETLIKPFAGRPWLVRSVGAMELAAGLWLARRQQPETNRGDA